MLAVSLLNKELLRANRSWKKKVEYVGHLNVNETAIFEEEVTVVSYEVN